MTYETKDFSHLLGMPGLSEKLLKDHFTLYDGYVKNTNKCLEVLDQARKEGLLSEPQAAEVRRRFGWEFNGMRLHEVYFGNLVKRGSALQDGNALAEQIKADFGSFDAWKQDFSGVGGMRGIGWACLMYDPEVGRLMNVWLDEHDTGLLSTGIPIVLLDVFEHAFMLDYGTDKDAYIGAFFDNLCWKTASERFKQAQDVVIPLVVR